MKRNALLCLVWFAPAVAAAQASVQAAPGTPGQFAIATFDPENAVAPISIVEGPGIKVGEGTVLHPTFGMETGFISNVFYDNTNVEASGILRLMAQIGTASLNQARLDPSNVDNLEAEENSPTGAYDKGSFQYQFNARLAYDQMLSGSQVVRDTGGLGVGLEFRGMANPMGNVSFGIEENFTRLIRAANFETNTNNNRDFNVVRANLLIHPQGRSVSGYAYYQNMVDVFEAGGQTLYPDRMAHLIGAHPMWRWLPQTTVYGDISLGFVGGIGSSTASMQKVSSMPFTAKLGIATLLSLKTSASLEAGYTNGFYAKGPSFSAPLINALVSYRYSPLGRVGAGYSLAYLDSVNANYYRDHIVRAFVEQMVEPLVFMVQPELHFREYNGVTIMGAAPTRDDIIFAVIGGVHYTFRNWIAATVDYRFSTVQTNFTYTDATGRFTIDPSYNRHELLAGLRVAM